MPEHYCETCDATFTHPDFERDEHEAWHAENAGKREAETPPAAPTADELYRHAIRFGTEFVLGSLGGGTWLSPLETCELAKRVNRTLERAHKPRDEREELDVITCRARMSECPRQLLPTVWAKLAVPPDVLRAAVLELQDERANIVAARLGITAATVHKYRRDASEGARMQETLRMDTRIADAQTANPTSHTSEAVRAV